MRLTGNSLHNVHKRLRLFKVECTNHAPLQAVIIDNFESLPRWVMFTGFARYGNTDLPY